MAIRLRKINGNIIPLCAAKTSPKPNDKYIDDAEHYALVTLFASGTFDNANLIDVDIKNLMEKTYKKERKYNEQ